MCKILSLSAWHIMSTPQMLTATTVNTQSSRVLARDVRQNPWDLKNSLVHWFAPDQNSQWGEVSANVLSQNPAVCF